MKDDHNMTAMSILLHESSDLFYALWFYVKYTLLSYYDCDSSFNNYYKQWHQLSYCLKSRMYNKNRVSIKKSSLADLFTVIDFDGMFRMPILQLTAGPSIRPSNRAPPL